LASGRRVYRSYAERDRTIPKKPVLDVIENGHRFSEEIMRKENT
jgi:hypothetical protein